MKTLKWIFLSTVSVGLLFGCSDVGFRSLPSPTCVNFNNAQDQTCVVGAGKNTYTVKFHTGDVDILIVNDNSSSMVREQQRMANSFPGFLDSINHLYYQVAMITTDVSASPDNGPRAANGHGLFQDGRFLEFTDENNVRTGEYILTKNSSNRDSKFRGTIQRRETLACEEQKAPDGNYSLINCPSNDERGIYALNLAVNRNEYGFFRPGAHLAVIILSDEDVRSRRLNANGLPEEISNRYRLEEMDTPISFVENMKERFPTKSISVHAVIVPPREFDPNLSCLNSSEQTYWLTPKAKVSAGVGTAYAELARPDIYNPDLLDEGNLVTGVVGNICASNYTAQLGNIAAHVSANARQNVIQMPCRPEPNDISVSPSVPYTVDSENRLIFNDLPIGAEITVTYLCPAHI